MGKRFVRNYHLPLLSFLLFSSLLSIGLLIYQLSQAPKQASAVVGDLKIGVGPSGAGCAAGEIIMGGGADVNTSCGSFETAFSSKSPTFTKVIATANGAAYFCGGDDACLYDINVANAVGIYGAQNSAIGILKLGSSGPTLTGGTDGSFNISGNTNICNLKAYTGGSGTVQCDVGFYTYSGVGLPTGQILCCKVSNPL